MLYEKPDSPQKNIEDSNNNYKKFRARVYYLFDSHSLEVRIYNSNFDQISTLTMRIGKKPKTD